jgi:hypothetical protein
MRPHVMITAVLAVGGCANDASPTVDYDAVARAYGAQLATSDGGGELAALADAMKLARGETVPAARGDAPYDYAVRCFASTGAPVTCGDRAANADVTAVWGNGHWFHLTQWHIRGVANDLAFVSTTGWGSDDATTPGTSYWMTTTGGALAVLPRAGIARAGAKDTTIEIDDGDTTVTVDATATFEDPKIVHLYLDDRVYWLDRATAEVTVAGTVY